MGTITGILTILVKLLSLVGRPVSRRLGRWPIRVTPELAWIQNRNTNRDPLPAAQMPGARQLCLHFFNHADKRHVNFECRESRVRGVRGAYLPTRTFTLDNGASLNVIFDVVAPPAEWAVSAVHLSLKGTTDAGEKIRWRGRVPVQPYEPWSPLIAHI